MKIIVQEAFQDTRKSNYYIIDQDFKSKKYRYSARSYLKVYDIEVALIFKYLDDRYIFIQDNTSIHIVGTMTAQFTIRGIIKITNQPLYSLDLNLIKHIQQYLKVRVYKIFLEVARDKSESEHTRQRLESYIQAIQDTLNQSLFNKLYLSIPARLKAYITAKGWHTKY